MQKKGHPFPQDIYLKDLWTLDNIHFTPREIDVIACLGNGRGTSKTASLLSLSPHTVLVHSRNIMAKLGCNSRDGIIDFVERSDKFPIIKEYYVSLIIRAAFLDALKNISKLKHRESLAGGSIYWQDKNLRDLFMNHLVGHLECAGISAVLEEQKKDQLIEFTKKSEQFLFVLIEEQAVQDIPRKNSECITIKLRKDANYYFAVFEVLRMLIPFIINK